MAISAAAMPVEKPGGLPFHSREYPAGGCRVSRLFTDLNRQPPDVVTFRGTTKSPEGSSYTRKQRLGFALQAIRSEIKQSWLLKIDLACGPLTLITILVPPLFHFYAMTASLFTLGVCECFWKGRQAYKSPEAFLKKLKS